MRNIMSSIKIIEKKSYIKKIINLKKQLKKNNLRISFKLRLF